MMPDYREILREIRTFPQLIAFLHNELDWPVGTGSFDDLTFDYTAEELGIDAGIAAKIQAVKRLRPLTVNQPWGIFFVEFERKRLPVVALRRVLTSFVLKQRASANKAERAAWHVDDMLFISAYGEGDERRLSFAHFNEDREAGDLPTLRVLGWDGDDTDLHLDDVAKQLHEKLRWPEDTADADGWRERWSSAFTLRHREVITTSKQLAVRLADLARAIRLKVNAALAVESEKGPLRSLMAAFKESLIHDLTDDDFADMYAQTIAYGLLSARVSRPAALVADNIADMVPITNPFLKELMETFLLIGGRRRSGRAGTGIDFDELGVNEVVQLLRDANMEAVLIDFGDRNPEEDPVIHFYELFLKEYDAKKRTQRGVFYTPRPIVSYIVRSVDELLRTEFGLEDGLADMTTWGEMAKRNPELSIPAGTSPDAPFVAILDPAAGTGTFLVEAIGIIHKTMTEKWRRKGHMALDMPNLWNEYVPKHLLPRLFGYELMMAPYAIAHMKVGLKLKDTGYRFGSEERVRVYLTNSLEPPQDFSGQFEFTVPALAHEAQAVNKVKRLQRFTVVIGNPPYSNYGQLNRIPSILTLLEDYKRGLAEKKINIDDDFIKFVRFSESLIEGTGVGVHGMITNNAYLDGLTHRRMRQRIMDTFSRLRITNLHGSSKKKELAPDGTADENVFDITVGVAIGVFVRQAAFTQSGRGSVVEYTDIWGTRDSKTRCLSGYEREVRWCVLTPAAENFFFVPKDFSTDTEYRAGTALGKVFVVWQNGLKTDRDELFFDFDRDVLEDRMRRFFAPSLDARFRERYNVAASSSYDIEARRLTTKFAASNIHRCLYRPMDFRWLYYDVGLTSRPAERVMKHMLAGPNLGMIATRQTQEDWAVLATRDICGHKSCAAYDINSLFPLYIYDEASIFGQAARGAESESARIRPNLAEDFAREFDERVGLSKLGDASPPQITPEDIFQYIYAVFHSPGYRSRYAALLKIDFPRLPFTGDARLFRLLSDLGGELVSLHLLESPKLDQFITTIGGPENPTVGRVGWSNDTVWLDAAATKKGQPATPGTSGFHGVPEDVWNFHIGGYQVCEKWLKDRKGRTLSDEDIAHYQKIVVALHETIRIMAEIDEVIEKHGGWPGAFG